MQGPIKDMEDMKKWKTFVETFVDSCAIDFPGILLSIQV